MMKIFTIASNTFIEVIRQPVYVIIATCGLVLILLSPNFTMFAMLENHKLIKDMGLATLWITGILLATFSASHVLYQEIENKTILTILTKPVSRVSFIIGKFLGLLFSIGVAQYILTLVLMQLVRTELTEARYSETDYPVMLGYIFTILFCIGIAGFMNFFYDKQFMSVAILYAIPSFTMMFLILCLVDHEWNIHLSLDVLDQTVFQASILVFLATTIIVALATALSTRLAPLPCLFICTMFFLLGLFSDYFFGNNNSWIMQVCYAIIPNLQLYWVIDIVWSEKTLPWDYFLYVLGYTGCILLCLLSLAFALFQERETA